MSWSLRLLLVVQAGFDTLSMIFFCLTMLQHQSTVSVFWAILSNLTRLRLLLLIHLHCCHIPSTWNTPRGRKVWFSSSQTAGIDCGKCSFCFGDLKDQDTLRLVQLARSLSNSCNRLCDMQFLHRWFEINLDIDLQSNWWMHLNRISNPVELLMYAFTVNANLN